MYTEIGTEFFEVCGPVPSAETSPQLRLGFESHEGWQELKPSPTKVSRSSINQVIDTLQAHKGLALHLSLDASGFFEFLRQLCDAGQIHYFYLCADLADAHQLREADLPRFAHSIMYEPRVEVLSRFARRDYPPRALRYLDKLATPKVLKAREYFVLLEASKNKKASKALNHASKIYFTALYFWNSLPSELQSTRLLSLLNDNPKALSGIWELLEELLPAPSDVFLARLGQSLASARSIDEVKPRCLVWHEKFKKMDEFPPPPIPGTDRLVPFVDARSLRQVWPSLRLAGLEESVKAVTRGEMYLYRWKEGKPAIVWLERGANKKWSYAYAFYGEDGLVKYETQQLIEALVADQFAQTRALATE